MTAEDRSSVIDVEKHRLPINPNNQIFSALHIPSGLEMRRKGEESPGRKDGGGGSGGG